MDNCKKIIVFIFSIISLIFGKCIYRNHEYDTHEHWYDGCSYVCVCNDALTKQWTCRDRCSIQQSCNSQTLKPDPCCNGPVCKFNITSTPISPSTAMYPVAPTTIRHTFTAKGQKVSSTTTATTPLASINCADVPYIRCADNHVCADLNLKQYCPLTCGLCTPCKDSSLFNCNKAVCIEPALKEFCPLTCGVCGQTTTTQAVPTRWFKIIGRKIKH